ncbi:LysR family transcriptional regulator [Pseudomonas sp. CC6-YY-74]|uniref:LysR family transcriptional regulator n=1 Tax=Pseudomonas sp. CC6-YY-74 TaxID=1930532 RepID=UPI0009A14D63|nr:LysR family transcriptional regulator [Pseudomonas sp. CC6-YY-74]
MFSSERLKGIDVFVSVAELGSFTAAADRLSLSSSAVSKGIARLESRLGIRLFERTTRRLALTDAGTAFYRTCTRVLADLEESELALHAEFFEPRGRIRIDLPASYGRMHVLPVVLQFVKQHPLLMPHISFTDSFVDPADQGIDILVRIGGSDVWPASLGHRYLGAERLIYCAAPEYLSRRGTPASEAELEQHDCVLYGHSDGQVNPWYRKGPQPGDKKRRIMPVRIAVGDGEGEVLAVLAGYGIAQLPTWLVQEHLDSGALIEVMPQLATDGLPMNLVWLKKREALPKVSALLEVLATCLSPAGHSLPAQADK